MKDVEKKIAELSELLTKHGLTAITVREGEDEIEVRREAASVLAQPTVAHESPRPLEAGTPVPAPLTGIFYRRPSPDEPEFVSEGDRIERGQQIGIIEAMKVFNPIESPSSGVVAKIIAGDGAVVQEGDALILLA